MQLNINKLSYFKLFIFIILIIMCRFIYFLCRLTKKAMIGFVLFSILIVILFRFVNPTDSAFMIERKVVNWNIKQTHTWQDFNDISDNIKIVVIASEDQNFANHFGFDFAAIEEALDHNEKSHTIRGGSTITQQVAKNLFLWSSRSFIRKGFEAWFTLFIEIFWSKERILEVYLNIIEWDEGVFGIEAASHHYFNVDAKNLTIEQASLLAAILPNPRNLDPVHPNEQTINRSRWIQQQIKNLGKNYYLNKIAND